MLRRAIACFVDSLLIVIAALLVLGIVLDFNLHPLVAAVLVPVIFACYHTLAVAHPRYGIGRTVAAILVVSAKQGPNMTTRQAIIRAIVRTVWWSLGLAIARAFSEPSMILTPVLIDLALITFTPWRQSIADVVASTVVVNAPPIQPHAYPAAVMYGRGNAEPVEPEKRGPGTYLIGKVKITL